MRSLSVLTSLIGRIFHWALTQPVTKRDAVVKHKAFATPAARGFRRLFQIFQDAALEVIDLGKAARQQMRAGLFAADAAGAEHRDSAVLCRIEFSRGEFLELPKTCDAGSSAPSKVPSATSNELRVSITSVSGA